MTLLIIAGLVAAAVVALVVAAAVTTSRFRARYAAEKEELLRRGRATVSVPIDRAAVDRLPPPVRRYLEVTGTIGKPTLKVAIVDQRGGIRTGRDKAWMPFESEQVYAMEPPGFLWLARARVAPLVHMMARDRFVDARGNMLIKLLGLVKIADAVGPELDQGAGLRFWGEVVTFPEMVVSPYLQWEPIDDSHARLTVRQGGLELHATVEFGRDGYPIATHADRYRDVGGKAVLTPWTGRCVDWKVIDGRLFPIRWESIWHLPEGDFLAVKMEILRVVTE